MVVNNSHFEIVFCLYLRHCSTLRNSSSTGGYNACKAHCAANASPANNGTDLSRSPWQQYRRRHWIKRFSTSYQRELNQQPYRCLHCSILNRQSPPRPPNRQLNLTHRLRRFHQVTPSTTRHSPTSLLGPCFRVRLHSSGFSFGITSSTSMLVHGRLTLSVEETNMFFVSFVFPSTKTNNVFVFLKKHVLFKPNPAYIAP